MYHYSVFKEGGKWAAQVLDMPDEEVVRYKTFSDEKMARTQLSMWRQKFGTDSLSHKAQDREVRVVEGHVGDLGPAPIPSDRQRIRAKERGNMDRATVTDKCDCREFSMFHRVLAPDAVKRHVMGGVEKRLRESVPDFVTRLLEI